MWMNQKVKGAKQREMALLLQYQWQEEQIGSWALSYSMIVGMTTSRSRPTGLRRRNRGAFNQTMYNYRSATTRIEELQRWGEEKTSNLSPSRVTGEKKTASGTITY